MSRILPVVDHWCGINPVGTLEAGLNHYAQQIGSLVETQAYELANLGKEHFSQVFAPGIIHEITGSYVVALEFVCIPGHHKTSMLFAYRVDGDAGCKMKLSVISQAGTVSREVTLFGGAESGYTQVYDHLGADELVTVRVELKRINLGETIDLLALSCYDLDLTDAEFTDLGVLH